MNTFGCYDIKKTKRKHFDKSTILSIFVVNEAACRNIGKEL